MSWDSFFEKLGDSEKRNKAIGKAISLVRTLAQPELGIGQDAGIFSSDPGEPKDISFFHLMPVLHLPRRVNLQDQEALGKALGNFNRAIVMVSGANGLLTSVTVRETERGGEWKVIRIGRSHLVRAFNQLNKYLEGGTISAGGREFTMAEHLALLPLVMLRMPDRRQYLLVMEVMGKRRREVPFLFFPVYDDTELGFEEGKALTLEDLEIVLAKDSDSLRSPFVD